MRGTRSHKESSLGNSARKMTDHKPIWPPREKSARINVAVSGNFYSSPMIYIVLKGLQSLSQNISHFVVIGPF